MGFTLLFVTIFLIHLVLKCVLFGNEIAVGKEKAKKKRREKFQTFGIGLSYNDWAPPTGPHGRQPFTSHSWQL